MNSWGSGETQGVGSGGGGSVVLFLTLSGDCFFSFPSDPMFSSMSSNSKSGPGEEARTPDVEDERRSKNINSLHFHVKPLSLDHLPGGTNPCLSSGRKGKLYLHDNSKRMLS